MVAKFTGPLHLGANPEECHDTAQFPLGTIAEGVTADGNWAKFRYVKFEDAVTYVAGHMTWMGAGETTWNVTNDISAAMAGYVPAGVVFQSTVPTQNQYGWVQCAGIATVLIGSASVIAGDWLKADGTTDGALDEATAGTDEDIEAQAIATIADAATGLAVLHIRGV